VRLEVRFPRTIPQNGYHSGIESDSIAKWVQLDLGEAREIEVRLLAAAPLIFPARFGFGFPVRFRSGDWESGGHERRRTGAF